jgi:hypothetical protein
VLFQYVIDGSDVKRVDVINDLGVPAFVSYDFLRPRLKYASCVWSVHHEVYLAKIELEFRFFQNKDFKDFYVKCVKTLS